MRKVHVAYDERLLDWKLAPGHPSDPIRAKLALHRLEQLGVPMHVHKTRRSDWSELELVHSTEYVRQVLRNWECDEWEDQNPLLAETADFMFGGTMNLVDSMIMWGPSTHSLGFAPQGAKHHAMREHSSGFCVFNDFAAAAIRFRDLGHRVLYVDWDAHHGDGVEALLRDEQNIVTCSIHDSSIFPGTGNYSSPAHGVYNWPLPEGSDGRDLVSCLRGVLNIAHGFEPTVLLVAAGADGHESDPLSSLTYRVEDFQEAAALLATLPVFHTLIGGAGGYQPRNATPTVWAAVVRQFSLAEVAVPAPV